MRRLFYARRANGYVSKGAEPQPVPLHFVTVRPSCFQSRGQPTHHCNFETLTLVDEIYWKLAGSLPPGRILGAAAENGKPQMWTVERGSGRVFVSISGLFRVLLLRGIAWPARESVDRFNDLVWPGTNLAQ